MHAMDGTAENGAVEDGGSALRSTSENNSIPTLKRKSLRPLIAFLIALFLFNTSVFGLLFSNWMMSAGLYVLMAEGCLLVLVAGLFFYRWLDGLFLATLLSCCLISLFVLGRYLRLYSVLGLESDALWAGFLAPFILISAAIPLYAMRFFWGMHLTREPVDPPRYSSSLEDFLSVMAVLGSCLFMTQVPQLAWEMSRAIELWGILISLMVLFGLLTLFVVIPTVLAVFKVRRRRVRWTVYSAEFFFLGALSASFGYFLAHPSLGTLLPPSF